MGRSKKKYPNLPNGFGSIRKLSGNRRNPYAVHPPVTEYTEDGKAVTPKALCYVSDWYVGFAVLTAYKAGTYTPGLEKDLEVLRAADDTEISAFTRRILADYTLATRSDAPQDEALTFAELYKKFYSWKYEGKKKYSHQSIDSCRAAYKNCSAVHNLKVQDITYEQLQRIVDSCPLKYSSLELIVSLLKQMYRYALAQNLVDKNPTELLRINIPDDDEHGIPFNDLDLDRLWLHQHEDIAQILLIMCYSGLRIGELKVVKVDLKRKCFEGGLKTRTSKERTVPIHSSICTIVEDRINRLDCLMPESYATVSSSLEEYLSSIGIGKHTSHDCRHTFSALCERYGVTDNDRKRMLGHKFEDVTNGVYGHRTLDDLRHEIEKIPCRKCVENDAKKRA